MLVPVLSSTISHMSKSRHAWPMTAHRRWRRPHLLFFIGVQAAEQSRASSLLQFVCVRHSDACDMDVHGFVIDRRNLAALGDVLAPELRMRLHKHTSQTTAPSRNACSTGLACRREQVYCSAPLLRALRSLSAPACSLVRVYEAVKPTMGFSFHVRSSRQAGFAANEILE